MAQPTSSTSSPPAQQAATAGVGQHAAAPAAGRMGAAPEGVLVARPQTQDTLPARPVLFDDIDPVLLMRLYGAGADVKDKALAAGRERFEMSTKVMASQQEDALPPPED
jgi:hypothetical protein